ncbi:MAG: PASTA domain-containing protein, partial [Clostridia bacterium]|nr:PASTA domain-containing protein [Clostridia bacterium]
MPEYKNLCMGCMIDKGDHEVCPKCGFGENDLQPLSNLPLRYLLDGRYLIGRSLETNSESVTYLAWDTEENIPVRVHEYFPEAFCDRAADGIGVTAFAGKEFEYNKYIEQFLDIARTLAKDSDLPSIFPVTDIFEANDTAYYVTDHVKTITMREFLIRNGGTLTWDQIRPLLMPVLTTLSALHDDGLIHRGISPETLIVGVDGKIRISGFCVADMRTARTEINSQLFPGFAAIEQYGFENSQGPWTDVYGLCATLYRVLVGSPPADATERVTNDRMVIPSEIAREIPRNVLTALADGLAILADDRTKSMADLKNGLIPSSADPDAKTRSGKGAKYAIIAAVVTLIILGLLVYFVVIPWVKQATDLGQVSSNASAPVSSTVSEIEAPVNPDATYSVDNLVGLTYADALTKVSANFEIKVVGVAMSNYEYGKIFEQSIPAGEKHKKGTVIEVKISIGDGTLTIPQGLIGQTVDDAYEALLDAGFRKDQIVIEEQVNDNVKPGMVVEID